jgi:NADH-quinone oxidoreductase subunit G
VKALPAQGGLNAGQMLAGGLKAAILLNTEPSSTPPPAPAPRAGQADMVITLSPFKANLEFSDVLLPIAPFSETPAPSSTPKAACRASTPWSSRWPNRARLEGAARAGQPAGPAGLRVRVPQEVLVAAARRATRAATWCRAACWQQDRPRPGSATRRQPGDRFDLPAGWHRAPRASLQLTADARRLREVTA